MGNRETIRHQVHAWVDDLFNQNQEKEITIDTISETRVLRGSNPIRRELTGWHQLKLRWQGEGLKWLEVSGDG